MKKRRARRPEGHVYRRGDIWWFKWTGLDGQTVYRSAGSTEREVAEDQLRAELERKSKGLAASSDPRRCRVDGLLEALEARYATEGRRSLERLKYSKAQLLRIFQDESAARVTGAHILRYAILRLEEKAAPATVNRELAALLSTRSRERLDHSHAADQAPAREQRAQGVRRRAPGRDDLPAPPRRHRGRRALRLPDRVAPGRGLLARLETG
jgi:hypothetical protein